MTLQQPLQLTAFRWREDWFPTSFYIRVCVKNRLIDTNDVLALVSSSHGAAKTMHTKHFGKANRASTAQSHGFFESDFKQVYWNEMRGLRTVIPINFMLKVLPIIKTAEAEKVIPDMQNMFEKCMDGAITVYEPSRATCQPFQRPLANDDDNTSLVTANKSMFQVNPFDLTPTSIQNQIKTAKDILELQQTGIAYAESTNNFKREQYIQDAECANKKRRIQWKEQLELLDAKYKWANEQGKVQLAEHITTLIADMPLPNM
jgi:hypothetical protein